MAQAAIQLQSLNALRFVAALLVFSQHIPSFRTGDGYCGVPFFFILSGFILTYKYEPILARHRWSDVWRFWVNRLARIYPVHLLAFILFLPYWWPALRVQGTTYLAYAWRNLTLTHAWSNDPHLYFSYNAPSWSLCSECFFYLCFPALLWVLNRPTVRSWRPGIFILTLWLLELAYCYCRSDRPQFVWQAYINPSLRLIDFTIGILLGLSFIQRREARRRQSFALATALEITAIGALLLAFQSGRGLPPAIRMGAYFTLPMAAIVFVFAHNRGLVSRLLSRQPFQFLGDISFSFFMLHYVLIRLWAKCEADLGWGPCPLLLKELLLLVFSLATAAIVHVIYERPVRDAIKARLERRTRPRTVPPIVRSKVPLPLHLRSLNALRFLAAILVFSRHVPAFSEGDGYCGVVFFFILSGFILTYKYQPILARPRWPDVWRFWVNRLARIYPVHLLAFVLFMPYWWLALRVLDPTYLEYAWRNLTLTHAWSNDTQVYFSYNAPSWSLCNECFFYFCFPALLWLWNRASGRSWVLLASVTGLWLLELTYCVHTGDKPPDFVWCTYVNPLLRLVDFTIGMLVGLLFMEFAGSLPWPSFRLATMSELTAIATLLLTFYGGHNVPAAVRMGAYFTLPMAAIVFIFAHDAGVLSKLLSSRPFQFLGDISFSFFMLHYVLISLWARYATELGLASCPEALKEALEIGLSIAAGAVVYFLYERPIRDGIKLLLKPRSAPTAPPVFALFGKVKVHAPESAVPLDTNSGLVFTRRGQ